VSASRVHRHPRRWRGRRDAGAATAACAGCGGEGARRGRALQGRCGQKRTRCPLASPGDSNAITEAQGRRPYAEQVGCAGRSALGCCSGSFSVLLGDSRRQSAMWHCCGQGRVPRPTALSGGGRRAAARCRPVWGQVRRAGLLDQPSGRSIPIVTKIVSAASGGRWRQERQLSGRIFPAGREGDPSSSDQGVCMPLSHPSKEERSSLIVSSLVSSKGSKRRFSEAADDTG